MAAQVPARRIDAGPPASGVASVWIALLNHELAISVSCDDEGPALPEPVADQC
jgi:hypothetical protein